MSSSSSLEYLYALADGDMDFVKEILELMEKNIPDDIVSIENAIAANDMQQIKRSAHHMKSSIQYSNYLEFSELLSVIETGKEKAATVTEVRSLLPELKSMSDKLLELIAVEKKKI